MFVIIYCDLIPYILIYLIVMKDVIFEGSKILKTIDIDLKYPELDIWVDCLHAYAFKPNESFAFHAHPNFELHYIVEGEGEIAFIDSEIETLDIYKMPAKVKSKNDSSLVEYQFKENDITISENSIKYFKVKEGFAFINPPGQFCWHKASHDRPMVEYMIRFSFNIKKCDNPINTHFVKEYKLIHQLLSQNIIQTFQDVHEIKAIFESIFEEAYFKKPAFLVKIKNEMINLIIAFSRLTWDHQKTNYFIPEIETTQRRLDMINSYILSNLEQNITIDKLSVFVNMSERNLCRFVKERKGISIHQYIMQQRINKAIEFIKMKKYTLSDVAFMTGFSSTSHLCKSFKKHIGKTPSEI